MNIPLAPYPSDWWMLVNVGQVKSLPEPSLRVHSSSAAAPCVSLHSQLSCHRSTHLILYWNPDILLFLWQKEEWLVFVICFQGASASHCWLIVSNYSYVIYILIPSRIYSVSTATWWSYNLKICCAVSFSCDFHSLLRTVLLSFIVKKTLSYQYLQDTISHF